MDSQSMATVNVHSNNYVFRSPIEQKRLVKNESLILESERHKILFVMKGSMRLEHSLESFDPASKGKIMLLPAGYQFTLTTLENSSILFFYLEFFDISSESFPLGRLLKKENKKINPEDITRTIFLPIKRGMWIYLNGIEALLTYDIDCEKLFRIKLEELYFLFEIFYNRKDLISFFNPLLNPQTEFARFVLANHWKARNINELAAMANYSTSGFEKRFRNTFGVTAGKWMKQQKAQVIYRDINSSEKTLKSISYDYGFSSPSHFNDFCKAQFGLTPGKIREQSYKEGIR